MRNFIAFTIVVCMLAYPTQTVLAQWKQTGGPPGGKIWCFSTATNAIVFAGSDAGLYRSTDWGDRWTRTSLPFQRYMTVATNPYGFVFTVGDRAFYQSTDFGETWNRAYPGLGDPWSVVTDGNTRVYITSSTGLYESINNGNTWRLVDSLSGTRGICFLTIAQNGSFFGAGFDSGVFRSDDSGRTWKQVQSGSHIYALHAGYDSAIYTGATNGISRSTDLGISWNQLNNGLEDSVVQCIHSGPGGLLLAATSGGPYQYNVQAKKWTRCTNGIPSVYTLSVHIDSAGRMFAGTYGRGIFQSRDNGATWLPGSHGLATSFVTGLVCTSTGTLLCSDDYAVYRSVDRGFSWTPALEVSASSPILVNSHDSIYVGSGTGLYLSSDDGLTWKKIGPAGTSISPLCVTPSGTIIARTSMGTMRSTNGGTQWQPIDSVPGYSFNSLVADQQTILWAANENGVYRSDDDGIHWIFTGFRGMYGVFSIGVTSDNSLLAGTYGAGMEGYGPTLYRSKDHGRTWTKILEGNATCFCLAKNGWIFSNLSGVQYSTDNGSTWLSCSAGLETSVTVLTSTPEGYIYAGTSGGGVYQTTSTFTSVLFATTEDPPKYFLGQNYPNPFNPLTSIPFELPLKLFVSMKIFDMLGRDVATLVAEEMTPGTHIGRWNAANVPSGLYFCLLKAGSFTQTRKLILLK